MSTRCSIYYGPDIHLFESFMCREGCVGLSIDGFEWDDLGEDCYHSICIDVNEAELTKMCEAFLKARKDGKWAR